MDSNAAAGHSVDVAKKFRPYSPDQTYLLPPSPRDWLDSGHLAYFILDVIDELDLGRIYDHYERELRGKPPHDPRLMVALLLYGYCVGVRSSRQIEKKTYEDVAFRVLAAETHPDHVSISEFRRVHRERLAELFGQVFQLCREAGLVKLGHFSLDGTKVKANASKHKAMSYRRMKQAEGELVKRARALLDLAEQADRKEDTEFGKGKRGDELPEELRRTETRLVRIREAKRKLEAEAKAAREQQREEKAAKVARKAPPDDQDGDAGSGGGSHDELPAHRVPSESNGKPTEKAQRNFTDPDSRIMKAGTGAFV
jgi:transposase